MPIISMSGEAPSDQAVESALHALDSGQIVAAPTDTSYVLLGDVSYTSAADRLFAITKRPRSYDLSLLVTDAEQAEVAAIGITENARGLMERFWPGALTLVLPRHPEFVADLGDDEETIGIRCPDERAPRRLCDEIGPLAVASACMHGQEPLTTAEDIATTFGDKVSVILEDGVRKTPGSTVVDVTGAEPKLIREGVLSWSEVQAALR